MTEERPESLTERELRALLERSVAGLEPDPMALPRLREGVPRRRARYRNVRTGAVVVLTVLAAVPALHGVDRFDLSDGPTASRTDAGAGGGTAAPRGDGGPASYPRPPRATGTPTGLSTGTAPAGSAPTAAPSAGLSAPPPPPCDQSALTATDTHLDPADAAGKVYGWFAAHNTTAQACRLADPGTLMVSAATGVDPGSVQVLAHLAGDAATALPAPASPPQDLVLPAGGAYRLRFGWVPGRTCPATTAAPSPAPASPAAPASAQPAAAGGTAAPGDGSSPSTSAGPSAAPSPSGSPGGAGPSITLAYLPQTGSTTGSTLVLRGSCGGTVYRAVPEAVTSGQPSASPS